MKLIFYLTKFFKKSKPLSGKNLVFFQKAIDKLITKKPKKLF
jgi:hypothetical protein